MDKSAQEFNKASHALLDAEVRYNQIAAQVNAIEKEIALLNAVEANLEENLRFMQRTRAIVKVQEFGKAMKDLNTCRNRRAILRIDLDGAIRVAKRAEAEYIRRKEDYEKAYDLLHNPPNNVIVVDFRRKDGQQRE